MNIITFDITYNKRSDHAGLKMVNDSEFYQLKLMLCGKYRIYNTSNCFIYFKNELISCPDNTKLREIFKQRRIKILVQTEQLPLKKEIKELKYYCKCKSVATVVCDKCDEFLCNPCLKKTKHSPHFNKLINIDEYSTYIKNYLNELTQELNSKILNDDAYRFFIDWKYDMTDEINKINQFYYLIKQELDNIKQTQIDSLSEMSDIKQFTNFTAELDALISLYGKANQKGDLNKCIIEKTKLANESREMLSKYNNLKRAVVNYTSTIKDIQAFNQSILKDIKERVNFLKRKYSTQPHSPAVMNTVPNQKLYTTNPTNTIQNNCSNLTTLGNINFNVNLNNTYSYPYHETHTNSHKKNSSLQGTMSNYQGNQTLVHEKIVLKLKDQRKILAFLCISQTFKEKQFIDHSNFKVNMTNEEDITQLNHANKLYMLSGKNYDKFYYYDYASNEIYFINNCLHSHYYGSLIYSPSNNSVYLLGGNNTSKCEVYKLQNSLVQTNSKHGSEWEEIPELNEQREEFAALCMNNNIYVFFGFCPKKGYNLSSIEKYNIETSNAFEIIYVNEQITLSSMACAKLNDDEIILLGGFDGKKYLDTGLIFTPNNVGITESELVIPNMNKDFQFLFHKESAFLRYENFQVLFDMKGNSHLISKNSYEVFSEINP